MSLSDTSSIKLTASDYADMIIIANAAPVVRQDMLFLSRLLRAVRDNQPVTGADHAKWSAFRQLYKAFLPSHCACPAKILCHPR
jgi:hypothetical protein